MKLFSNEKDNQRTSSQSKNPEGKKSGKQHPELKIISGNPLKSVEMDFSDSESLRGIDGIPLIPCGERFCKEV